MSSAAAARAATIEARLAELEARVAVLEATRPDRDMAAAAIRSALSEIWPGGIVFSAADVIEAAKYHPKLHEALGAALIDNAPQVGCWLRQHQGERDGIVIARHGRRWICTSRMYLQTSGSA